MKRILCVLLVLLFAVPLGFAAEEETVPAVPVNPGDFSVIQTESSVVIIPENPDTYFEYAVVTVLEQSSPNWISIGSASERGESELTERFPPRGVPYEIWVHALDSAEIVKRTGFVAMTPRLMLELETIGPFSGGSGGSTWYISYDGGEKWETHNAEPDSDLYIDIAKRLGKNEIQYIVRRAVPVETEDGITLSEPEKSVTALEGKIKARPALAKQYTVKAFVSEEYPENWTLTGGKASLEYSANGGASWSPFSFEIGLPLLTVEEQAVKKKAISYQLRIAADEASGTPASAPKKFNQIKQVKAPTVKPDYKWEVAKLKEGMRYAFAEPGTDIQTLEFKKATGDPVSIEEAITNGQTIYIYTPENGKKSRSALQTMNLAPRAIAPDEGEGLVPKKSSVSVQKGFEYFGSKEKWGSFSKGDTEGLIRRKATAKYNAKTNVNTGLAASRPVKCTIVYPAEKKGTPTVTIEPKKTVPLLGWELSGDIEGGKIANDSFKENNATVEADEINSLVSFSVKPRFSEENEALIDTISLSIAGNEIPPQEDGAYRIEGLRAGDSVTLAVTPKDRDIYRISEATVTILKPADKNPPFEIWFGSSKNASGNFGMATVSFAPVALAQSRTLWVELAVSGEVISEQSAQAEYSYEFIGADTQTMEVDLRAAMRAAGPGTFELRAYFAGGENTSDSARVTAEKTFDQEHFEIWEVETEVGIKEEPKGDTETEIEADENTEYNSNALLPGDTLKVTAVRDAFGNDLLPGAAYQWWRSRTSGEKGSPVPKDNGGNENSFLLTEDDYGWFYGVEIGVKDIQEIYFTQFKQVG